MAAHDPVERVLSIRGMRSRDMLTLGQAARIAGKGKTTLTRAIQAGRLSATRRDDGGYLIDPSELSRVYDVTPERLEPARRETPRDPELETRLALAEAELRAIKDMLAEVRTKSRSLAGASRTARPRRARRHSAARPVAGCI